MNIAADTNVLVYAEARGDNLKQVAARSLLARIGPDLVIPSQVMGELYNVMTRKMGLSALVALERVTEWRNGTVLAVPTAQTFANALDMAARKQFQVWDALILCTAAEAGCTLLLSEDMQDGFVYRGTTVADPFAATPHPVLASVLESPP